MATEHKRCLMLMIYGDPFVQGQDREAYPPQVCLLTLVLFPGMIIFKKRKWHCRNFTQMAHFLVLTIPQQAFSDVCRNANENIFP